LIKMQEKEYNWKAILYGAVPASIAIFFVFDSGISNGLKWLYLVIGILASMGITYFKDKKKQNIFTSPFIVVIIAIIVRGLKTLGFL